MGKKLSLEEVPFTNEFGHVINPGDKIIIVTKSTGSVGISTGTYLGLRNHGKLRNKDYVTVSVLTDEVTKKWIHKETKEEWNRSNEKQIVGMDSPPYPYSLNVPGVVKPQPPVWRATWQDHEKYRNECAVYRNVVNEYRKPLLEEYERKKLEYQSAYAKARKSYVLTDFPYTTRRTLRHNRIYPLNLVREAHEHYQHRLMN